MLFTCKKDRRDGEEVDEGLHRQREHNLVVGSDESAIIFLKKLFCAKRCADCSFFSCLPHYEVDDEEAREGEVDLPGKKSSLIK